MIKNPIILQKKVPAPSKFDQLINGTIAEVTAEDLQGITKINDYAFYNQTALRRFEVPKDLTYVGTGAFAGTTALTELYFSDKVSFGTNIFGNSSNKTTGITKLKLGGATQYTIDKNSLGNATLFEEIEFNEGFTTLNTWVLGGNYMTTVIMPSTMGTIGQFAPYVTTLKKAVLKAVIPPTLTTTQPTISTKDLWYVPNQSIEQYKVETNWIAMANKLRPLVKTETDLASIDTTLYTKACVIGNDKGIEDENNYKIYNYTNGEWVVE